MPDGTALVYLAAGVATLAAAVLPRVLGRVPVSLPMVFLAVGALAFGLIGPLPSADPLGHNDFVIHLTELCVVVSLMGAGLALDRRVSLRGWASTWRLLGISMPAAILAVALLGWGLLGFGVAGALLLGAVLAPTDPVLAAEVRAAEPAEDERADEDEVRFTLTSEAGLNDGLAFPFVMAAVAITTAGVAPGGWLAEWLLVDVVWGLGAGCAAGLAIGWVLRRLFFSARSDALRLARHAEGFVALAATLVTYGGTELIGGYGFVAVFVCACTIRAAERSHGYHRVLHSYIEQLERLLTVLVVFLLGGAAVTGLFTGVTWREVALALAVLFVVRPLTALLGLVGGHSGPWDRIAIAVFGVRGVGSLFYVAYAFAHGALAPPETLWRVVGLVIVGSIVLHGVSASMVMGWLDRRRAAAAVHRHGDPERTDTAI
ncbi:cation:proton antiporter [Actinophytocola sediminis]